MRVPVLVQTTHQTFETDFRRPLIEASARDQGLAFHIQGGRQRRLTTLTSAGVRDSVPWDQHSQLKAQVDAETNGRRRIVLTGVGGVWAPDVARVASLFPTRERYYDIQDDLSYGAAGLGHLKFVLRDAVWRCLCPNRLVLETGMRRFYKKARFLDNASDVLIKDRSSTTDRLVYVGSIDERVDVSLLKRVLDTRPVDIWGKVHETGAKVIAELEQIASQADRLRLRGSYTNDELPRMLNAYATGIVPYHADHRLTRHINPDKIYHYLNGGLSVLSAGFPQALRMAPAVTIVNLASDIEKSISESLSQNARLGWRRSDYVWDVRWRELCEISAEPFRSHGACASAATREHVSSAREARGHCT